MTPLNTSHVYAAVTPDVGSHLFKCADIIRNAVGPTDCKEFILSLVYYKAISDEFKKLKGEVLKQR